MKEWQIWEQVVMMVFKIEREREREKEGDKW